MVRITKSDWQTGARLRSSLANQQNYRELGAMADAPSRPPHAEEGREPNSIPRHALWILNWSGRKKMKPRCRAKLNIMNRSRKSKRMEIKCVLAPE